MASTAQNNADKDVRQGLHTPLHTQGLDGLLHLYIYKRLEKRGRALRGVFYQTGPGGL
jgi:hypothetical protein